MVSRISHPDDPNLPEHEDHRRPDGSGWITLLDPEGNEFCIPRDTPSASGPTS